MVNTSFFDESREQSQVKAAIVAKYFWAWANVILAAARGSEKRIAYIDLFAGPGRYKGGTDSTPVKVLESAIADQKLRNSLVTIFNDKNSENVSSLRAAIDALPNVGQLRHRPQVINEDVGDRIVKWLRLFGQFFAVVKWRIGSSSSSGRCVMWESD